MQTSSFASESFNYHDSADDPRFDSDGSLNFNISSETDGFECFCDGCANGVHDDSLRIRDGWGQNEFVIKSPGASTMVWAVMTMLGKEIRDVARALIVLRDIEKAKYISLEVA